MSEETQQAAGAPGAPVDGERQRLMRDAVVNNLAAPVTAVVGILLVPVMLRALGQDNYGLWIVAVSMSGVIAPIDLGLHLSVNRAVAADPSGGEGHNVGFVRSAAGVYILVGIAGCIFLGGAGILSGGTLHLPPVELGTASLVFWLVGAAFCADRIGAFGTAVLAGLRRFDLINLIAGLGSVAWAGGVIAILMNGGAIADFAACLFAVAVLKSIGTLWLIARLRPAYRFRPDLLHWKPLRLHMPFAASSLLMDTLSSVSWNSAPVLIGYISGSAAAVPFYVGQKFPVAVSAMSCRAAEVLFPAASESRHDLVKSRELLRVGSRLIMVMLLPFAALLFVAAPDILHAWIGDPPPGSAAVLRIMSAAVLAEGVLLAPVQLFWGRGIMRPILITNLAQGFGVVALTVALVYPLGAPGAAWGMLIPIGVSAAILFAAASRACEINAWELAAGALRGLGLPVLACVLGTWAVLRFGGGGRLWVVAALFAGVLMYLAVLLGLGGNGEERRFARGALNRLKKARKAFSRI
jgi:O-antigen/teichoic acid export membrane protein